MVEPKDETQEQTETPEPYEAPKIVYREPLEAVATTCVPPPAKADAGSCPMGPISS